jgi:uncharacterized NAD-dependent epimerase/dehydratase family protein
MLGLSANPPSPKLLKRIVDMSGLSSQKSNTEIHSARIPFRAEETPLIILCEGVFGEHASKTATGVIRYGRWPITAVIDSTRSGQTVRDVTAMASDVLIVPDLETALMVGETQEHPPKALLIGTAPQGGGLPPEWRGVLLDALDAGLHLISGLHDFLKDDAELVAKAQEKGLTLWDVRDLPQTYSGPMNLVAQHKRRPRHARVLSFVGTDCAVGKMYSALEVTKGFEQAGQRADFLATGQTGILISGTGVPLDRMIGDFMAGHVERCVFEILEEGPLDSKDTHSPDTQSLDTQSSHWVLVEGQGSLLHPGYSGVTLSLLHGANPDGMILCHNPELETIWGYDVVLPKLSKMIDHLETAANWIQRHGEPKAKVLGICLNTAGFSEQAAKRWIDIAAEETDLPVVDAVRFGCEPLIQSLLQWSDDQFVKERD